MAKKKTADELEAMVEAGESIEQHLPEKLEKGFHKKLTAKLEKEVIRTTVDFGAEIVSELDFLAAKNNISKAAVIKLAVLDYLMRYRNSFPKK